MKKARMNISHFRFILFNLKIFGEIVIAKLISIFQARKADCKVYSSRCFEHKEAKCFTVFE